ncbi:Cupin domain-containing protein [Peribacillus simplex]|uniref:Cupin domain-containing protein n=1 Tax=Peribacillus simplex TaxID=1478 RepID=A0A9X8RDW4_9BACI|nr:cupin domain-containing protein [Peribacillus simplex]SIS03991.1 Cupin domain-containing protein [Peribacillus simplex]
MSKTVIMPNQGKDYRGIGGLVKRLVHPSTVGSENLAVSICYLNPGEEITRHSHTYEEAYFVLQGTGKMILGEEEFKLEPNMSVYIPSGKEHAQINDGSEPLVVLCSLSPAPDVW